MKDCQTKLIVKNIIYFLSQSPFCHENSYLHINVFDLQNKKWASWLSGTFSRTSVHCQNFYACVTSNYRQEKNLFSWKTFFLVTGFLIFYLMHNSNFSSMLHDWDTKMKTFASFAHFISQ